MAQNQETNQETLDRIVEELENLELQDHLQRFRAKRRVVRAIDRPYLLSIPRRPTWIDADFYNDLREKLGKQDQVDCNNFVTKRGNYKSPRNLVRALVRNSDATKEVVEKLFEKQYELRWHTTTGDPDQFSFYGFCQDVDQAGGNNVMTYDTRRAHVISRLYHARKRLLKIRGLTYRQHCPPVYVRTKIGKRWTWQKWICHPHRRVFEECDEETDIDWISNEPLRNYITVNSVRNNRNAAFPNGDIHLYWAVIEEDDSDGEDDSEEKDDSYEEDDSDEKNDLDDNLGKTQVYVGKAGNGIKQRWAGSQDSSHCRNMELSRNVMYNMMNYDPDTLATKQLVQLRFLLHKAHHPDGSNSGLFIMGQGNDDYEQAETRNKQGIPLQLEEKQWILIPTNMKFGMNGRSTRLSFINFIVISFDSTFLTKTSNMEFS